MGMSEQKTHADIIGWMRKSSTGPQELADMLEAAHERERGDCAKLRDALIDVVKRLEVCVGCDHHTFHPTATTCDGITSVGKCGKIATCAAIFKARAALADPPRNCDAFSYHEAETEFQKVFGRPWNNYEDELACWLFAKRNEV